MRGAVGPESMGKSETTPTIVCHAAGGVVSAADRLSRTRRTRDPIASFPPNIFFMNERFTTATCAVDATSADWKLRPDAVLVDGEGVLGTGDAHRQAVGPDGGEAHPPVPAEGHRPRTAGPGELEDRGATHRSS